MKKILLGVFSLLFPFLLQAQTFSTVADTVTREVSSVAAVHDDIINLTGGSLTLNWHVKWSDFPTDWRTSGALGLCDNVLCRQNSSGALWNGTSGSTYTSTYLSNPAQRDTAAFDLSLDFSAVTTAGVTHYVTVTISDANSTSTKDITFAITRPPLGVTNINTVANDVVLYPNPARDELNVVYDANADVKSIAVYNIIGKVMSVYKVNGDSANLNLENIPSGIYFVRLLSGHGDVVVTRKFTKQ